MIYQKIFTDEKPYQIGIGNFGEFPEHRHADFEFNFCVNGEFDIIIDKKVYCVSEGETTVIPPMCSHSIPNQQSERTVLTLIVGMSLLKKYFKDFSAIATQPCICELETPEGKKAKELFYESAQIKRTGEPGDELLIMGNVYKIMAYVFKSLANNKTDGKSADYREVENIEKAIELIHYNYKEPLPIEYVAEITGYSKSNFCKMFKKIVGESFHKALNRRRAECAAGLLTVTNLSVAEITDEVGFSEPKAFCRVFKAIYGITPGEYRRAKK